MMLDTKKTEIILLYYLNSHILYFVQMSYRLVTLTAEDMIGMWHQFLDHIQNSSQTL